MTVDDTVVVDTLPYDVGSIIKFSDIMLVGTKDFTTIGRPFIGGAVVKFEVEEQTRCEKVMVFKFKRRKRYKKLRGHRQWVTVLRVAEIDYAPDLTGETNELVL